MKKKLKISTKDAKRTAIKDIASTSEGATYTNLLFMSIEKQLEYLPKECRVSLDDIDLDNCKRIAPNYHSFYLYYSEPKKIRVTLTYTDSIEKKHNSWFGYYEYSYMISRSCFFFMKSFGIKTTEIEDGRIYIDAVNLVRHKRFVSSDYLKNHNKKTIEEYNEFMTTIAQRCERLYKNFDVNNYDKFLL